MNKNILTAAYGTLLHDVGKPMQRSYKKSDLTEQELDVTPIHPRGKFHSHLHAGYTSRFLRQYLGMFDAFEAQVSSHHLNDPRDLATWIRNGDRIAAAIDRKSNELDDEDPNQKVKLQQVRLASIFREVDFGKPSRPAWFELSSLSGMGAPHERTEPLPDLSVAIAQYQKLMESFYQEVKNSEELGKNITSQALNRMYALFNQYMVMVPASTYESGQTAVSLYDHSKLAAAIAACQATGNDKTYRMLEFDMSGIQKFIFKVTEGSDTKQKIAKSLRGRSLMISLITDIVTMSYLHEFDMPQVNIIFNTGGGALLLLPDSDDFELKVQTVSAKLQKDLYFMFGTAITFVWSSVVCDTEELKRFKIEKAMDLKAQLEEEKSHKYASILGPDFFYRPAEHSTCCELCGSLSDQSICKNCQTILELSDLLVHHADPVLLFFFDYVPKKPSQNCVELNAGPCTLWMMDRATAKRYAGECEYIESMNTPWMGHTRLIANSIPLNRSNEVIALDEICETLVDESWGDPKLGILKMDVDNLGSIFAYGLPRGTRSLSKYLTLSRLMEVFFGRTLVEICKEVSEQVNPDIDELTSNGTMFYINYAGGDDLVILGPAASILQLTQRIHQKLSDYVKNENITISAGIWIQNPKEPVRFGIQSAERMLECSKERADAKGNLVKNGVTLLDTTVSFQEFEKILENTEDWISCISRGAYSRTGFYRLMKMIDMPSRMELSRRLPLILYTLVRNTKDKDFQIKMKKRLNEILPVPDGNKSLTPEEIDLRFEKQLSQLVLEMKLAIMQTRSKN